MTALTVEVEGVARSGSTKSNKPYHIHACYVTLPGSKYPQACELFADKVINPGAYSVPLRFAIEDRRPVMSLDLSAAQPVATGRAAA